MVPLLLVQGYVTHRNMLLKSSCGQMKTSSTRGHIISNRHDSTKPGDLWGVLCIAKADVGASDESRDQVVMLAGFVVSPRVKDMHVSTQLVSVVIAWTFMITSPSSFP